MRDDNRMFWVDCEDEEAILVMRKGQLLTLVETAADFGAKGVVLL